MTAATIGWSAGAAYWEGWIGFIALLVPTLVANLTTLLLITFSHRLNRSPSTLMVRYLAAEDGAFSAVCLVQCALNLSQLQLVGHMTGCQLQAVYGCFFTLAAGYTLCCIAYHNEQRIALKPGLSRRRVLIVHLLIWSWSGFIALLCSFFLADARLMPSGTYCFANLLLLRSGLTFYLLGVALCGAFLAHRYWRIYRFIRSNQQHVVSQFGEQRRELAQERSIRAAKRMLAIVVAYLLCFLPAVVVNVYELVLQEDAQPAFHIAAGYMGHLNSLLDPILYVWMNAATRVALWEFLAGLVGRRPPAAALTSGAGTDSATMNGAKVQPVYHTTAAARAVSASQYNAQRQRPSVRLQKPRAVSAAAAVKAADDCPSAGKEAAAAAAAAAAVPSQVAASPLELMWRERHLTDPLSSGLTSPEASETQQDERQAAGGSYDSLQPMSPHPEDARQELDDGNEGSVGSELISR